MTVRELLSRVDSAELTEWVAFLQIEREGDVKPPDDVDESVRNFFRKRARNG